MCLDCTQVLSKDLDTARTLVEDIVTQLGAQSLTGARAHDACSAVDAISVSHTEQLLPCARGCDAAAAALCMRCAAGKNRMTGELVGGSCDWHACRGFERGVVSNGRVTVVFGICSKASCLALWALQGALSSLVGWCCDNWPAGRGFEGGAAAVYLGVIHWGGQLCWQYKHDERVGGLVALQEQELGCLVVHHVSLM